MQGSNPGLRYGTAFCRHRKSGLPSTPPNHKSDGGSLQSWNRPPPQLPATGSDERRLLSLHAKRPQVIATNFAGVRPWRGNRLREENGRVRPVPALYEQTSWSGFFRALVQKVLLVTMASSAIMERSASNRAIMAAGGTAMALKRRPADVKISGTHTPDTQQQALPRKLRLTAAGGKRNNAQQNADRRLPPGGNTSCRRTR